MSKWSKYNEEIDGLINIGRTDWNKMAKDILGERAKSSDVDLLRTYIKRRSKRGLYFENKSETKPNDYNETPFILSAWREDGTIMDINEYCEKHRLPKNDITSYKLITHSKSPYYNCVFKEVVADVDSLDLLSIVDDVVSSLGVNDSLRVAKNISATDGVITRLIYTDTHIAMCTDIEGSAMYPTPWNEKEVMDTLDVMCAHVIANRVGSVLYIDDLGDFLDGWDGYTTRKGHKLPQNMSNKDAFRVGLEFKTRMIERLIPYFSDIICHNVCIDNHSGSFAGVLNHAFKRIAESMSSNVSVHNLEHFMEHYFIGKHGIVLTHGKDDKSLKFGFKPKLDPVQIEKIDHYLKHNKQGSLFKECDWIWVDKGDSHQMLFDFSSAQDFNYMNYLALSPASEWVQTNFKKGDRGFTIQQIDPQDRNIKIIPITL